MQDPATGSRRRIASATAVLLLSLMGALMFASAWDDTIIFDEQPHIAGGLSYLRRADYRFNPEHPPLMKDLAAAPLLFLNLNEPWEDRSWEAGEAWDFGAALFYASGNDPDSITRVMRTPMILFTIAFGAVFFWWTQKQFGASTAVLALFFFTFSPTFLAHGRFVTTDVGAAAGFFFATIAFLSFLKNPSRRTVLLAGAAAGFALLTKFSAILLVPIVVLLAIAWVRAHPDEDRRARRSLRWARRKAGFVLVLRWRRPSAALRVVAQTAGIVLIGFLSVYAVYLHHTWNYPLEIQRADTEQMLAGRGVGHTPKDITLWASDKPLWRPWAQYFAGLIQTVQRAGNDQNRFFFGEIFSTGIPLYFPLVYGIKEPLPLHLLTLAALLFALSSLRGPLALGSWLRSHFTEFAFLVAIAVYWAASINAGINIGVRHILPTFPFIYVLLALGIVRMHRRAQERLAQRRLPARLLTAALGLLLAWQAVSVLRVHPSYLAYFNELAGGPDGGWRYVVDSNIDWGQDLRRLAKFTQAHGITEIHLDYFGTAQPAYYLGEKYRGLSSCDSARHGWVTVSVMWYQHSRERPECDYRRWLPMDKLVTKIGYSLFVFQLD
jgi:4-amino-4-deoxy-L-arabinose transferase-like glycosyltransferase